MEDIGHARIDACEIAKGFLSGEFALTDACRRVQRPLDALGVGNDAEFVIFIGIVSEADIFPLGAERVHWNADALAKKDVEHIDFERHYRPLAEIAFQTVLRRFSE